MKKERGITITHKNGNNVNTVLATGFRYIVQIQFKDNINPFFRMWDIHEPVKTLKEARTYKTMIDSSVKKARVIDSITDKIVEEWIY